eukprot:SAG31_NODE_576_length_13956_cov_10.311828_4_plen_74_part_00
MINYKILAAAAIRIPAGQPVSVYSTFWYTDPASAAPRSDRGFFIFLKSHPARQLGNLPQSERLAQDDAAAPHL